MWSRLAYQLLLWLVLPVVPLRLWWRGRREPDYRKRWKERFGHPPAPTPVHCIWFHAVSAGEAIAAAPLISALTEEFPSVPFLVTTMTPAGAKQVRSRLGGKVAHCYAPYDFRFAVQRFLRLVQPRLLVLVETELWPNLIDLADRRAVPVLVINARLSERSARAYGRLPGLTKTLLQQLRLIACQYPQHMQRFVALGAAPSKLCTLGSVKFDISLPSDHAEAVVQWRTELQLQGRRVWIAASTHPGEDDIVLDAHRAVRGRIPNASLLLVPRHPARSPELVQLAVRRGLSVARLSDGVAPPPEVLVCDGFGLLQTLYGLSEVAFIGGSLVPKGGHNPIEAAICGLPLAMGPERFNFEEVAAAFAKANCLTAVTDAPSLADAVVNNFENETARQAAGQRGLEVVRDNSGAQDRLLDILRREIKAAAR